MRVHMYPSELETGLKIIHAIRHINSSEWEKALTKLGSLETSDPDLSFAISKYKLLAKVGSLTVRRNGIITVILWVVLFPLVRHWQLSMTFDKYCYYFGSKAMGQRPGQLYTFRSIFRAFIRLFSGYRITQEV